MKTLTPQEILDLPIQDVNNDAGATNVREYLRALLRALWDGGEGFSGKRPFGNSGWIYDLAEPLITAEALAGAFDEDGYLLECDDDGLHRLIASAIEALR